jgi:predicted RNA-binding protein with TRAM domain
MMMNNRRSFAPVNVGDELDVKIEAVGEKGDGLVKIKGFVLFVPGVKEGDEVKIRVTRVLKKVGFAEVVSGASSKSESSEEVSEEASSEESEEGSSEETTEEAPSEESDDFTEEGTEDESEDSEDF